MDAGAEDASGKQYVGYSVEAARVKDHVLISISGRDRAFECIIALPDSSRFSYLSLTGQHCMITNIRIE